VPWTRRLATNDDYSAAKAALLNFCKSLSKDVGRHGIRVNTISPGPVSTGLWLGDQGVAATISRANGVDPDAIAKQAAHDAVTGRFTQPAEAPTSCCSWPATAPRTSPAPTSTSTAA
jgi:NAD(P)-dependent dehydrogenase (short-subunit alcohol dehydrogenase family)